MRFFSGPAVLIIDELGYLPMPAEDAAALFQVISRRYQKGSVILTTNRNVASWGNIFADSTIAAAMLDRLLHRSVVFTITADSYRLRRLPGTSPKTPTEPRPPLDSQNAPRVGNFADQLWVISVIAISEGVYADAVCDGMWTSEHPIAYSIRIQDRGGVGVGVSALAAATHGPPLVPLGAANRSSGGCSWCCGVSVCEPGDVEPQHQRDGLPGLAVLALAGLWLFDD